MGLILIYDYLVLNFKEFSSLQNGLDRFWNKIKNQTKYIKIHIWLKNIYFFFAFLSNKSINSELSRQELSIGTHII